MSAYAGILHFDGAAMDAEAIRPLRDTLARYAPGEAAESHPAAGAALFVRRLEITPEDRADRQPVAVGDGSWLTWNGRLDNRADLMMELGLRPSPDIGDVHVAGRAISRWGTEDALRRLVGDWSAVVCDPTRRAVTLAVDFMGVRPLYYVVTDRYCAWSTALEGLVALTGRRHDLDDVFFTCSIMRMRMPGHTPYRGISSLNAAHRVRIDSQGVDSRQYWTLPDTCLRYRDKRDYHVHLRTVFREAVRRRLRASAPVWMELSGGWDSSSIVCMAARLAEEGAVAPQLATVSHVTPGDPESDETRFIEAVEAHTGLPSTHVVLDRSCAPIIPNPIYFRTTSPPRLQLYARMREAGISVLLSGRFGDTVFGNVPLDLTSTTTALRSGRLLTALEEARAWSLAMQETGWSLLWKAGADLGTARGRERRDAADSLAGLSRWAGASRLPMQQVLCVPGSAHALFFELRAIHTRWRAAAQRPWRSRAFVQGLALYLLGRELLTPAEGDTVTLSYPLADRDLIELVGSIPSTVLVEPGRPRALMRDALGEIVPERVRQRFSKGYAAPFRARLVRPHVPAMLEGLAGLAVVQRGYVDPDALRKHLEQCLAGGPYDTGLLLRVLSIERWLALEPAQIAAA